MKCIYIRQYQTNFELPKKAQSPPGSIVTININYKDVTDKGQD